MVNVKLVAGVLAGVLVVSAIYSLRRNNSGMAYELTVFTRRALYGGKYGAEAMSALAKFRSELFKNAMAWKTQHNTSQAVKEHVNFDAFRPYIPCPPDRPLKVYTEAISKKRGDAPKPLCEVSQLQAPCIIYSAGSNNFYAFEIEMLNTTSCEVHTFDCTHEGYSQDLARHKFHRICLGSAPQHSKHRQRFKHLAQVMQELGHAKVDLFKIDIEGYEYDVFQDWSETDHNLPDQLSIELHYGWPWNRPEVKTVTHIPEMALLYAHLANLGYGMVGFQQNPGGACCAEVGMLRVEAVQRVSMTVPGEMLVEQPAQEMRRRRL